MVDLILRVLQQSGPCPDLFYMTEADRYCELLATAFYLGMCFLFIISMQKIALSLRVFLLKEEEGEADDQHNS